MTDSKPYSLLILLAPALLCVTAVVQRVQVESSDLNPWKGGGFGMFADTQKTADRFVVVTVVDENNVGHWTTPPKPYSRESRSVRTLPTQENVDALARQLAAEEWVVITTPGGTRPVLSREAWKHPGAQELTVKGVTVQVFEYTLDRASDRMTRRPLRSGKSAAR